MPTTVIKTYRKTALFSMLLLMLLYWPFAMAEVPAGMLWDGASAGRLQVMFPGNGYSASWQFNRCICGDVLVNSDSSLPGDIRQGDMLLVGGRAVVYRGFDSERPEEVMSMRRFTPARQTL